MASGEGGGRSGEPAPLKTSKTSTKTKVTKRRSKKK